MRACRLWIVALFAGLTATAASAESPYFSCLGRESAAPSTLAEQHAFGVALHQQFSEVFAQSEAEIQKNIDCLNGVAGDCSLRMDYLFKTLPGQLAKYRENLALSRWNVLFRVMPKHGEAMFNHALDKPHPFWMEQVKAQPLTPDEILKVQNKFQAESARVFKQVQSEAESSAQIEEKMPFSSVDSRMGAALLSEQDWLQTLWSESTWAQVMEVRFDEQVFQANRKRLIQRLVEHPLLAFIETPDINKKSLLAALINMRRNLRSEQNVVREEFAVSDRGAHTARHPSLMWSARGLYPLLDYSAVVESLLFNHPEYCSAAGQLFAAYANEQMWNAIIFGGVTLGLVLVAPPVLGVSGLVLIEGYYIYSANRDRARLAQSAFTTPLPSLNLRSPEELYIRAEDDLNSVLLSPLALTAIPAFRFTRILRMLY